MTEPAACPTCKSPVPIDAPGGACPRCLMAIAFATDAGAMTPDVEASEVERRFPGYEVLAKIGRGGMGVVFRARQRVLDREVALKVLPGGAARPAGFTERFEREAKALARLQHPGIVQVFDFGVSEGWCFLAMELVDGTSLRRALADGRLAPKEALAIVPQICDALQYAHDHGVVHRDIKPDNLLLTRDGRVKVADFGLAKLASEARGDSLTRTGQSMGTPLYMAPEQVESPGDVDHRADIYSLGVVFYEMLTGELPIGRFPVPSKKTDVDARIDDIVLRTLEKERDARFQRVAEVKTKIDEAAAAPPAGAKPPAASPPPHRSRVSRFAVAVAFAPLVVAMIAVLVWSANQGSLLDKKLGWAGFWSGTAAFVLALLALVAWGRIRHSGGALHGRWFAAIGLFGACLGVLALAPLYAWDNARVLAKGGVRSLAFGRFDPEATSLDEKAAIDPDVNMVRSLVDSFLVLERRDFESVRALYAPRDAAVLAAMPESTRSARAAEGLVGLPLCGEGRIGEPPTLLRIETMNFTGDSGTVVLGSRNVVVTAPILRVIDPTTSRVQWLFTAQPVEVMRRGTKPADKVLPR